MMMKPTSCNNYVHVPTVYFIVQMSLDYVFVWVCACMGGFIVYLEFGLFV